MGRLTTHVLDMAVGRPAAGLRIELLSAGSETRLLKSAVTNGDGRVDAPLLEGTDFRTGQYELRFYAGDYLRGKGLSLPDPAFLDLIPVRFGISEPSGHYHVPLLLSPFGYSTYRGS
jgi:5-hydroxyisourate hydrolase